jgi:hypothetical protein
MAAADERVAELLQRWLASLDLHARYLDLDDAAYARVQDWPRHQRPTRWIVELARSRLLELQRQLGERQTRGDADFSAALELMGLLTNLLGSEHIERFIPLAVPRPVDPPTAPAAGAGPAARRKAPSRAKQGTAPRGSPKKLAQPAPVAFPEQTIATVIADAVRFLSWGREWPQLASSIARLADRPPEQEVWKILRQHRSAIEAKANQKSA